MDKIRLKFSIQGARDISVYGDVWCLLGLAKSECCIYLDAPVFASIHMFVVSICVLYISVYIRVFLPARLVVVAPHPPALSRSLPQDSTLASKLFAASFSYIS